MAISRPQRCTEPKTSAEAVQRRTETLQAARRAAVAERAQVRKEISVFDRINVVTQTPAEAREKELGRLIEALDKRANNPQHYGTDLCLATVEARLATARETLGAKRAELGGIEAKMDQIASTTRSREWILGSPAQQQFKGLQQEKFKLEDDIARARRDVGQLERMVDDRRWLEGRLTLIRG